MNTIVILTHSRPECLWLCLESLLTCRGIEKYHIYVATNEDCHPEIEGIVRKSLAGRDYELDVRPKGWLIDHANCEAFKAASDRSDDYFIEIAEDEEVSHDLFEMFDYINKHLRTPQTFGISPSHRIPMGQILSQGAEGALWRDPSLTTLAALIYKQPFDQYLRPYLNDEYYSYERGEVGDKVWFTKGFHEKLFPEFSNLYLGADGMITRIMQRNSLHAFTAAVPRAHEIGFFGAHERPNRVMYERIITGTLEHKVKIMRELVRTGRIRAAMGRWDCQYQAITPDHQWTELEVISGNAPDNSTIA